MNSAIFIDLVEYVGKCIDCGSKGKKNKKRFIYYFIIFDYIYMYLYMHINIVYHIALAEIYYLLACLLTVSNGTQVCELESVSVRYV